MDHESVQATALKTVFDLLHVFGFEAFNMGADPSKLRKEINEVPVCTSYVHLCKFINPSAVNVLAVSLFHTRAMLEGPAECSHCALQDQETEGRELERWRRVKFKAAMVKLHHAIWHRRRL